MIKFRAWIKTGNETDNYVESRKLEKGSIATDWTPSPEDKINVSDMRKPEIEESEFYKCQLL